MIKKDKPTSAVWNIITTITNKTLVSVEYWSNSFIPSPKSQIMPLSRDGKSILSYPIPMLNMHSFITSPTEDTRRIRFYEVTDLNEPGRWGPLFWGTEFEYTIRAPHIGQAPPFGHLRYLAHSWFNSHQVLYMTPSTLCNHSWHVILAQNLIFCEMKKKLFVTPAGYAVSEFDFRHDRSMIITSHKIHDRLSGV